MRKLNEKKSKKNTNKEEKKRRKWKRKKRSKTRKRHKKKEEGEEELRILALLNRVRSSFSSLTRLSRHKPLNLLRRWQWLGSPASTLVLVCERWTELSQLNSRCSPSADKMSDRHCRKDTSQNMGLKSLLKHCLYSRPFVSQSTFMWSRVITLSFINVLITLL